MTNESNILVSVIYATFNRRKLILEALADLRKQTYKNIEVIVVDNGSTDGTANAIEKQFPGVTLIKLKENIGCPSGRNVGIRAAHGEYIMTLDDDAFSEPTLIEKGVYILKNYPQIGIVYGKIFTYPSMQIENWNNRSSSEFSSKSFFTYSFSEGGSLIRKKVLDEVGMYPENFFRQFENRDLGNRILNAGYRLLYYPRMVLYHKGTPAGTSELYYSYRNLIYLYIKQYPVARLIAYLMGLTGLFFIKFTKQGQTHLLVKAWFDIIKETKILLQQRNTLKKETIKEINRLRKCVNNLPNFYSEVAFEEQSKEKKLIQ